VTDDLASTVLGAVNGADVASRDDELVELYAACYSAPPWSEGPEEVAAYRVRLEGWAAEPSFTGFLARDATGRLVGAVYGWSGPPELSSTRLPGVQHERVFHVGDLMVHPHAQRRGLGRLLLGTVVSDRRPAVLVTHPESDARHLYAAMGWLRTGTVEAPGGPPLLVFLRP
jgi:GNAT superfamily N-acetyltransferase